MSAPASYGEVTAAPEKREPMTDREILAVIQVEMSAAHGASLTSVMADRRAKVIDDYLGALYGNEREGRSSVVMRDVFEVVEWMLPDLVETFTAGETLARFNPQGAEDEAEAEQQTDLTNHVFLIENHGFNTLHHWFKDALLQQGVVKYWWEESKRIETETYEQMTVEQIALLGMAPDIEIVAATPLDPQGMAFDVTVRRTHTDGQVMIKPIPGEEFWIDSDARSIEEARFVAHQPMDMTASKLRELGYPEEVVDRIQSYTSQQSDQEYIARTQKESTTLIQPRADIRSDSERPVSYVECFVRIDADGDGISELLRVCAAGQGESLYEVLHKSPAEEIPFASLSPVLVPHRYIGLGVAECISDLQELHTAIARQYVDALYLGNNPRYTVERLGPNGAPKCDIDALLSVVPGGVVPIDGPGVVQPLITEDVAPKALAGMQWLRETREERTGVNRYTQGLEAPELNQTASGMQMLQSAANKRIKFIARIFAETGVKALMRGIAGLLKRHQRKAKTIRLRGQWVPIDPSTWQHDYDCTIEVGLGYGDKNDQIANMQTVLALQEKAAGLAPNLVSPEKAHAALGELLKAMGYKNPNRFFEDPATHPMPAPEPSFDEKKLASDRDIKLREMELEELKIQLEHEREMLKLTGMMVPAPEPEEIDQALELPGSAMSGTQKSPSVVVGGANA